MKQVFSRSIVLASFCFLSCISMHAQVTASITSYSNVACYGGIDGSATVTASGGTTPYTYSWAPSGGTNATANNLPAGSYTCTVTDATFATATASVTINQPGAAISATITSQTNIYCNGGNNGSATGSATGGTNPYFYSWTPTSQTTVTATNLTAGCYTFTATDANGCTATATTCLTQPTALTATSSYISSTCGNPNGQASVVPSGGTPGYSYSWSPTGGNTSTATGLSAGSYTCTITDSNGCTFTISVVVPNSGSPTLTVASTINPTCGSNNGSITVTGSGGSGPYTYSWAPAGGNGPLGSNLVAGSYTCTMTDSNGCTATASATLTAISTMSVSVTTNNSGCTACTGTATANVTGGQGPLTYTWSPAGNTQTITNLCVGGYTVTVTDSTGCSGSGSGTVGANTGFNATVTSTPANCWYNTGTGTVTMSGGLPPYTYLWTPSNQTTSTATNLSPGVYHIIVGDQSGCYASVYDTIQAPPQISSYVTNQSVNCGATAGMAIVHASGGVPPLTYHWSNNVNNDTMTTNTGGAYNCTITDAHGCTNTAYVTLLTTCDDIVRGNVYEDPNLNCVFDAGDVHTPWVYVYAIPGNYNTWTDANGNYVLHLPAVGTYTIHCNPYYGWMIGCPVSASYTATFTNLGDTLYNYDFGMHPSPVQNIGVWLTSTPARPGFPMTYTLGYYNNGTIAVNNVVLTFNHDPILNWVSSSLAPSSYSSPTAVWNLGTLNPGYYSITITMNVAANAVLGNSLCANANIMPIAGESYVPDNYANDCRVIQGSFDPNEKDANAMSLDPIAGTIDQDDSLITYTVHFQNTGTDTAFNIVVIDTLSANLDPLSIEPGPSSHSYTPELCNGVMKFNFYNIQLPDSNRNEPMSHGWFQYRAKMKSGLIPGDIIQNTAGIYFDYNAPVMTNTTSDTVIVNVTTGMITGVINNFSLFPNPATYEISIHIDEKSSGNKNEILLTDAEGRIIQRIEFSGQEYKLDVSSFAKGIYFCTLQCDGNVVGVQKLIKE